MSALVAIPVRNRLDLTRPLVEALVAQNDRSVVTRYDGRGYLLCVYNNGSTDGTREWLATTDIATVDAEGKGLHEMWNHAIERAIDLNCHLVLLNNDLVIDGDNWIARLVEPLDSGWDAVCPNYDGRRDWRTVIPLRGVCGAKYDGTGGLAGFAFAVSNRFLKTGYRFPTEAKWWFGDTDLAFTLERDERPYGMVRELPVEHVGGGSQTAKDHDLSEQCIADKAWFESKWGALCTSR